MPKPQSQQWPADKIERRPLASLVPYARNARKHDEAQIAAIAASIREWGWTMPVLIDEAANIIAGHGRVLAAQRLGFDDIPCMVARGWSESQRRAYVIADNRLTETGGGWDTEMLALEIEDLRLDGFDLDLTGFDAGALEAVFDDIAGGDDDEPDSSTKEIDPDDYQLGHRCPRCGFEFDDKQA